MQYSFSLLYQNVTLQCKLLKNIFRHLVLHCTNFVFTKWSTDNLTNHMSKDRLNKTIGIFCHCLGRKQWEEKRKTLEKLHNLLFVTAFLLRIPSRTDVLNSMKIVIPLHSISLKETPNDVVTPQRPSKFTPKMKANAVPRLLSSLV